MLSRQLKLLLANFFTVFILVSCASSTEPDTSGDESVISDEQQSIDYADHDDADDYNWGNSSVTSIMLSDDVITIEGSGAVADASVVTINAAGNYSITGTLSDGQIVVDSDDEELVRLILNGVDISSLSTAPINIISAEKTLIVLADNTDNYMTDSDDYVFDDPEEDEPDATIFSKDDLTISGNGSLTVSGNYKEAIKSKDGLIIDSGTIHVNSVDDGIQGKDYLIIKNGNITVNAVGDGLKSNNDDDASVGYVKIEDGSLTITSGDDAIQAESSVIISGGDLLLVSGGGSQVVVDDDTSAKGVKAGLNITIDAGSLDINSADDAIHANETIIINGGLLQLATGDDGIHADSSIEINAGIIDVSESYEGIESSLITINDGQIHLSATDDALNAAGNNSNYLFINGGYVFIDADGDGIDVNGYIEMSGGIVIVNGPTANNNGALDYDDSFIIDGGFLVATGSSRMAQAPGNSSSQNSVILSFDSMQAAGTLFHIENNNGEEIFSFAPLKSYQSIAFSSDQFLKGSTYNIYLGGTSTGDGIDGLYVEEKYTAGSYLGSFSISNTLTVLR